MCCLDYLEVSRKGRVSGHRKRVRSVMRAKEVRGLSPLIATAVLLAAVIAIGYVIYSYVSASAAAVAQKPQLLITADATDVAGTTYIELSIKNVGGAPIQVDRVIVDTFDVSEQLGLPLTLQPGGEIHRVVVVQLSPGEHIVVVTGEDNTGNVYQFKSKFIGGSATSTSSTSSAR